MPTRYALHLGDIERVGAFYGLLQVGAFNRVGRLTYREADAPLPGQPPMSALDTFEGRFVALSQVGLVNLVYKTNVVGVRLGLVNHTGEMLGPDARHFGLVEAGLVNLTIGHHAGLVQGGGVNYATGFFGLAQLGGCNSVDGRSIKVLLQGGAVNLALEGDRALVGLQVGGFNAIDSSGPDRRRALAALQLGIVNVSANAVVPFRVGLLNLALPDVVAGQIGLVNYGRGVFTGALLGAVNVHGEVRGLEVGVVNVAQRLKGVQLGLINVARHGGLPVSPVLNVGF